MPSKKPLPSWKTWLKVSLIAFAILLVIGYIVWDVIAHGPLTALLTNHDRLVALVRSWGIFAPLIFIILQVLQTVIAPIPGQIVGGIGGFLFGWWGVLWTTIGSIIGFYLVFLLSRRFGRPLLEKLFSDKLIKKFDFLLSGRGTPIALFLIFLLPGFPDDLVCYMAGLTKIPLPKLMLIAILGRFPTIVITNYFGAGLSSDNLPLIITIAIISVIILGLVIWQRERIITFLKGKARRHPHTDPKKPQNT